ncbi:MAG TPA: hypothetical protein VHX65_09930 [Pirellulales bacterium]|jgi:hypothetical protein|nr:hypothetical protein [Pirellulales bacterium]
MNDSPTADNTSIAVREIAAPAITAPTIPAVDWRPIQGSLGAFRTGYEEIEQFIGQLLDEIDTAWQQLEAERVRASAISTRVVTNDGCPDANAARETRENAHDDDARRSAENCSLVPFDAQSLADDSEPARFAGAVARRISELEQDRFALQAEVEFLRRQLTEQSDQISAERRMAAEERTVWAGELRQLREAIHRQMETFGALPPTAALTVSDVARADTAGDGAPAASDPVLGPLLSQIKTLHRDAEARRQAPASAQGSRTGAEVSNNIRVPSAARAAQRCTGR